ncbi:hypothetical protein B0H13DRAFT_2269789 [Mycena leptocephala]|nr:hypothetical protein B0H13DRAFT_2269789 [Mycena leptocephala]
MFGLVSLLVSSAYALTAVAVAVSNHTALAGEWAITDYQGQFFNLVNTQTLSLSPVQGWPDKTVPASQWLLVDTTTPNLYEIINVGTGNSLSYSTLLNGGQAIRSQIVCNQQQISTWFFTVPSGLLIESKSGLAVTSWPIGSSKSNPLTLEQVNSADSHQIFKLVQI